MKYTERITYRVVATGSAVVCAVLALIWIAVPGFLITLWGLTDSPDADTIGRRGGALFLGIALVLFLSRAAAPSPERRAIAVGFGIACLALAAFSLSALLTVAGPWILLALVVEVLLGAAMLTVASR